MEATDHYGDATARITIQLQLEDLEEDLRNQEEYQYRTQFDRELSPLVYRQELRRQQMVLRDRETPRAIGDHEAVQDQTIRDAEDTAAARVRNENILPVDADDNRLTQGSPTPQAYQHQPREIECEACLEMTCVLSILTLPCEHQYCKNCVVHLFESAVNDESSYPPHCCQEITAATARGILSTELVETFENKALEYLAPNRTYCSATNCSTFITPANIWNDIGTCPICQQQTCTTCKSASHGGVCPFDVAHQALMEIAREKGWKRCYSCNRLVELNTGCNHITCLCNAEFCYVCGERWRTCVCASLDEARLIIAVHDIERRNGHWDLPNFAEFEDRILEALPLPAQRRPDLVYVLREEEERLRIVRQMEELARLELEQARAQRAMQARRRQIVERMEQAAARLLAQPDCDHREWRRLQGRHECGACHRALPLFIFECERCNVLRCHMCRLRPTAAGNR